MSLNWDMSKVEDHRDLIDNEWGITQAVIWMTMAVGMQEITKDNVGEFCRRAALLQAVDGPWLVGGIYVTDEMIQKYVGLGTNVSNETWAKWAKRQLSDVDRLIERQREESARLIAEREEVSA
jgi:hypothetical protein